MSYSIRLTDQAGQDLDPSGVNHSAFITVSWPSVSPPYPPNRQQYTFSRPSPDDPLTRDNYVIRFRYSQDETAVGHYASLVWPVENEGEDPE